MTVHLLGCPTNLGLPESEARRGPAALRTLGLAEHLRCSPLPVVDHGDFRLPDAPGERGLPGMARVEAAAAQQRARVAEVYRPGDLLLTVGGDHSAALGSVSALRSLGEQFDLVWIDAHGDFNSPGTSPTGNVHGMVLAMICGYSPAHQEWLDGRHVGVLGARDLDAGETQLLQHAGVRVLEPATALVQLESYLSTLSPRVFISFDLDSLDPSISPGVSTPSPDGFSLQEALHLVSTIARRRQVVGLDVVEYNPANDRGSLSGQAALAVVGTVLAAQAQRLAAAGTAAD